MVTSTNLNIIVSIETIETRSNDVGLFFLARFRYHRYLLLNQRAVQENKENVNHESIVVAIYLVTSARLLCLSGH